MLKTFSELEKAVARLIEKADKADSQGHISDERAGSAEEISISLQSAEAAPDTGEAADLIRRAIKRLRSL